jgi:hypothetical protein
VAVVAFVIVIRRLLDHRAARQAPRRKLAGSISRVGMLWLSVYDAVWLFAAGLLWQGGMIVAVVLIGCLLIRSQQWLTDAAAAAPGYRVRPRPVQPPDQHSA